MGPQAEIVLGIGTGLGFVTGEGLAFPQAR